MTAETLACANCGTDNRPGRRFCRSCGVELGVACPACGTVNEPGDRFCGSCGTAIETGAVPVASAATATGTAITASRRPQAGSQPAVPAAPTERRLVSVLFADLVGSTGLAEGRDPEAVRELLSRYYDVARTIVERYGGIVEKFIGDAVAVVWGARVAHEDDAERAVRAALDLVAAVGAIDLGTGLPPLSARAAVLTGEVAAGVAGTGEGVVSGDLMNSASRLQGLAEPGTVLAGEATVRATESAIAYEPRGEVQLRGRTEPIAAWRAVRVVAGRGGYGRTARLEAPFVGRDDELRLLKELYHATARDRRARLVSITGIAGIGKSRLAWEFWKYIDGLMETVYWHAGRSPAYGEGLAFRALAEMVRGRARIADADDTPTAVAKLSATLAEWIPDTEERAWVEARLSALLGEGEMPPGGTDEVFAAWRTLFERIADREPTILLFEDLHWADEGLLDFVERLVAANRARPILVITLARPELLERRPTWGAGARSLTTLELGPLGAEAMDLLLLGLAPGLPPQAIRAIRDRAEGVPLYAVETVRMLLDTGRITETDGRYRLAGALGALAIPPSLTSLLGARLDALPDDERALLGHAAVLGQSFTSDTLSSVAGLPGDRTRTLLDRLVTRELLVLDEDPRSPERGQYGFIQALLREVAYGRLSRRERLARHLAAAAHFERQAEEDLPAVVATHLVAAHAAADGADAASLAARARTALLAAAERAGELHAWKRAIAYLDEAASIAADEDERMDALERIVTLSDQSGVELERAETLALEVIAWRRTRGDTAAAASHERRLGSILILHGRPADARDVLADAWSNARTDTSPETVRLGAELARSQLMTGDWASAMATIEEILPSAERIEAKETIAELLASKMWALAVTGRPAEAFVVARGNLRLADEAHALNAWLRTSMNLSSFLARVDPREAFVVARDALERARRLGYEEWAISLAANAADAAIWTGDWWFVEETVRANVPEETHALFGGPLLDLLATAQACRGQYAEAEATLARAEAVARNSQDPQVRANAQLALAWLALARIDLGAMKAVAAQRTGSWVYDEFWFIAARAGLWAGDVAWADSSLDRAVAEGERPIGFLVGDAQALRALADLLAGRAGPEAAAAALERAADVARAAGALLLVAINRLDRAVFLPRVAGAAEAAAEARSILEHLGARPLLDRLDAAGWTRDRTPSAEPGTGAPLPEAGTTARSVAEPASQAEADVASEASPA